MISLENRPYLEPSQITYNLESIEYPRRFGISSEDPCFNSKKGIVTIYNEKRPVCSIQLKNIESYSRVENLLQTLNDISKKE